MDSLVDLSVHCGDTDEIQMSRIESSLLLRHLHGESALRLHDPAADIHFFLVGVQYGLKQVLVRSGIPVLSTNDSG